MVLVRSAEHRPFPDTLARLLLLGEATLLNVTQAARVLLLHAARGLHRLTQAFFFLRRRFLGAASGSSASAFGALPPRLYEPLAYTDLTWVIHADGMTGFFLYCGRDTFFLVLRIPRLVKRLGNQLVQVQPALLEDVPGLL